MKPYIRFFLALLVCLAASFVADPITAFAAGLTSLAATSDVVQNQLACITTVSFKKNCGANPGGLLSRIYIVSKKDVDTIPAAVNGTIVGDITLLAAETWAVWEGDKNMFSLTMNSVGEGDSKAFTNTLEMHRSGFNPSFEDHLSKQINGEFVLLAPDRLGRYRVIGDGNEGATFPSDGIVSTTGVGIADKNGNTLKWTHDSANKPFFYEGVRADKPFAA
jgi:hypothetical protein